MLISATTTVRVSQLLDVMRASMSIDEVAACTPLAPSQNHIVKEFREFLDVLRSALQQRDPTIIIAKHAETLIGFAYYRFEHDSILIEELHVKKPYQRQGVGTRLLHQIEKIAQDNHVPTLRTRTAIMRGGIPWKALEFWTHRGFTIQNPSRVPTLHFIELQKPIPVARASAPI